MCVETEIILFFLKEVPGVPYLEPCSFMPSNNSWALGIKSLRYRVQRAILKV